MSATQCQRSVWRRHRAANSFSSTPRRATSRAGGLAAQAEPLDIRVVILPADPDATDTVPLDADTAAWLEADHSSPYHGQRMQWGSSTRSTSGAVVHGSWYRADQRWERYLAIHRHGGLEAGIATLTGHRGDRRLFALRQTAALVWQVAALQLAAGSKVGDRGSVAYHACPPRHSRRWPDELRRRLG